MIVVCRGLHYSTERGLIITEFVPLIAGVSGTMDIQAGAVLRGRYLRAENGHWMFQIPQERSDGLYMS